MTLPSSRNPASYRDILSDTGVSPTSITILNNSRGVPNEKCTTSFNCAKVLFSRRSTCANMSPGILLRVNRTFGTSDVTSLRSECEQHCLSQELWVHSMRKAVFAVWLTEHLPADFTSAFMKALEDFLLAAIFVSLLSFPLLTIFLWGTAHAASNARKSFVYHFEQTTYKRTMQHTVHKA